MLREVDPSLRAKLRREIEKDYGINTIMPANRMPRVKRLDSRSLGLNYIMGGGYPFGHMTRLWGAKSGGKTTLIYNAFRAAQEFPEYRFARLNHLASIAKLSGLSADAKRLSEQAKYEQDRYQGGLRCLYVCAEKRWSPDQLEAIGVDMSEDRLEVVPNTRIEEIGGIVQKSLQAFHVVAVDSTTGTISLNELGHKDGILESHKLSLQRVKIWSHVMDWWRDRMSPENVLIFTSHAQTVIGASTWQKLEAEKAPGGSKLNHEPSVILHLVKAKALKYKGSDGAMVALDSDGATPGAFGKKEPDGQELVVLCEKNSTAKDRRIALLHFDRAAANFDLMHDYVKLGIYFKVINASGNGWYTLPDGKRVQKIRKRLSEDEALRRQIEDVVYRCSEDAAFEKAFLEGRGGAAGEMYEFEKVA
jgi:RecA/RadA recombinase